MKAASQKKKKVTELESAWLRQRSKEWNAAWRALVRRTGDADFVARDEESGEAWQYMGTYWRGSLGWRHQFRHRQHPTLPREDGRWVLDVFASEGWKPEDEKRKRAVVSVAPHADLH